MLCCAVQIITYTEAVKTVDHDKALGKPNSLWIAFAKFYEKHGDVDNARVIFNKATQVGPGPALCCFRSPVLLLCSTALLFWLDT